MVQRLQVDQGRARQTLTAIYDGQQDRTLLIEPKGQITRSAGLVLGRMVTSKGQLAVAW